MASNEMTRKSSFVQPHTTIIQDFSQTFNIRTCHRPPLSSSSLLYALVFVTYYNKPTICAFFEASQSAGHRTGATPTAMSSLLPAFFHFCCWLLLYLSFNGGVQSFCPYRPFLRTVEGIRRTAPSGILQRIRPSTHYASTSSNNDNGKRRSVASISSNGVVNVPPRSTGSLGKPSKKKKKQQQQTKKNDTTTTITRNQNSIMSKKDRQRTANGTIQSESNGRNGDPAEQGVQVVRGNRGNKSVTIVRGMDGTPLEDKKKILKLLKSKLGVGGTLVDGVLEVQGDSHAEKVLELLKGMGYVKARKVGK